MYAYDFSAFHTVELGADARFHYHQLPLYWSDPDRRPFLIRINGGWAGFALIKRGPEAWDMAEFFILRSHRRRGAGTQIAHHIWTLFPGPWEVRVLQSNKPALVFWERAIAAFTGVPAIPVSDENWKVFSFASPPA